MIILFASCFITLFPFNVLFFIILFTEIPLLPPNSQCEFHAGVSLSINYLINLFSWFLVTS